MRWFACQKGTLWLLTCGHSVGFLFCTGQTLKVSLPDRRWRVSPSGLSVDRYTTVSSGASSHTPILPSACAWAEGGAETASVPLFHTSPSGHLHRAFLVSLQATSALVHVRNNIIIGTKNVVFLRLISHNNTDCYVELFILLFWRLQFLITWSYCCIKSQKEVVDVPSSKVLRLSVSMSSCLNEQCRLLWMKSN